MSFYSAWQPLDRLEDAHTALVFGFLRHAPVDAALRPWLSNTLGRDVAPEALTIDSFWPSYDSILEGQERTVPELVFNAQDSEGHLVVVVEAKRQPKGHELDQLVREAIDTAHTTNAQRLAMIMVGVDTGTPERLHAWQEAIQAELEHEGLYGVELELRYSSWAQLGNSIETASDSTIDLAVYAEDVLAQMRLHGLLGYKGAPMSEDLGDLTIANAFTLVNRTIKQARQFFLALTADSRFINLGLEPASGRSEMLRDGVSTALSRPEGRFVTTTLFSHFRKRAWPSGAGAFAAFMSCPRMTSLDSRPGRTGPRPSPTSSTPSLTRLTASATN